MNCLPRLTRLGMIKFGVVLTRPVARQEGLIDALTQHGVSVLSLPALSIEPLAPIHQAPLQPQAMPYDLIVFVSRAAVEYFPEGIYEHHTQAILASVGSRTYQAIKNRFVDAPTVLCPAEGSNQDSEALWAVLQPELSKIKRVLIVRAQNGRDWLHDQFIAKGCQVDYLAVYARRPLAWSASQLDSLISHIETQTPLVWLFTSLQAFESIELAFKKSGVEPSAAIQAFVVTHPKLIEPVRGLLATSYKNILGSSHGALAHPLAYPNVPYSIAEPNDASILATVLKAFK